MGDDWTAPLPVRRVVRSRNATLSADQWPATLASIAQILERGLDLAQATVVVGESGRFPEGFASTLTPFRGEAADALAERRKKHSDSVLDQRVEIVWRA